MESLCPKDRHPGRVEPRIDRGILLYLTHTYTERYGDYAYPEIIIYSVSFQDYVDWRQRALGFDCPGPQ